jgi:hypothetical protein
LADKRLGVGEDTVQLEPQLIVNRYPLPVEVCQGNPTGVNLVSLRRNGRRDSTRGVLWAVWRVRVTSFFGRKAKPSVGHGIVLRAGGL